MRQSQGFAIRARQQGHAFLAKEGEKSGMNGEEGALSLTFCNID